MKEPDLYRIALGMVPGIGGVTARKILALTKNAETVFSLSRKSLLGIPGVGDLLADRILHPGIMEQAKKELEYIHKRNITCLFYGEDGYPENLLECSDAPLILYVLGRVNLIGCRMISIVGTRRPGSYGLDMCRELVRDLAALDGELVIVSGLAYGIDHCAHMTALEVGLQTIAVLGHGLKYLYPALHRTVAKKITAQGALLTDFPSHQKPERNNFIRRNRIIAGLSDATIVVQSGCSGGALITADLANSYHRDVFTFPGRVGDPPSAGCNQLIKSHQAALVEGAADVAYGLSWDVGQPEERGGQTKPSRELSVPEKRIMEILRREGQVSIDRLSQACNISQGEISGILLDMELDGWIRYLPGNAYSAEG